MNYSLFVVNFCVIIIISFAQIIGTVTAENINSCKTPKHIDGECIDLQLCNSLQQLLLKIPLDSEDINLLTKSQCGTQNNKSFVCCPLQNITATQGITVLPQLQICGNQIEYRTGSFEETELGHYAWMALLEYSKPDNTKGFHCGGVLISNRYVLTASHCINGKDIPKTWELTSVRLGEHVISTNKDCDPNDLTDCAPPALNILIEEKIQHESYNPVSANQLHDIGLLRLQSTVSFNDFVKPICLPINPELNLVDFDNKTLVGAGFGRSVFSRGSNVKTKVGARVMSFDVCHEIFRKLNRILDPSQICLRPKIGSDLCQIDSGGPIMAVDNSGRSKQGPYFYVVGISTTKPNCGNRLNDPIVYTKTISYIDWILSNLRK